MVLCRAFLVDLGLEAPRGLLGPLGLAMYSISTHDDVVDELPKDRGVIAGLVYAGNIASLHGISLLVSNGYARVAQAVVRLMNLNHCFQTDIAFSIWSAPSDEKGYLRAISHTGYWAAIGTLAAAEHVHTEGARELSQLQLFAMKFGELYGRICQVYDDIREIDDDRRHGYFSLPISIAMEYGYNLDCPNDRVRAIARPKEIAEQSFRDVCNLCGDEWPVLLGLARRMYEVGQRLLPA